MLKSLALRSTFLAATWIAAAPVSADSEGLRQSTTVPLIFDTIGGATRPIIDVRLNGHPYKMMVHSSASMYAQVVHSVASEIGVNDLKHAGSFGIETDGKVSALGRDEGTLARLDVGKSSVEHVPVSVFETPAREDVGILGTPWITDNHVIVDYPSKQVILNPTPDEKARLKASLQAKGYVALPLEYDDQSKRYLVTARVGSKKGPMVVSTVGTAYIDEAFSIEAGIQKGKVLGKMGGPRGALVYSYETAKPITVSIAAWTSKPVSDAVIVDLYGYDGKPRPKHDAQAGSLGADLWMDAGAVIDFGSRVLYIPPPKS